MLIKHMLGRIKLHRDEGNEVSNFQQIEYTFV